jgi:hypothetical protein
MHKVVTASAATALAFIGGASQQPRPFGAGAAYRELGEERLTIKYDATAGLAVVVAEAESEEPLSGVEVRDPRGAPVLRLSAGGGPLVGLSEFIVESRETSASALAQVYVEGEYQMRCRTMGGELALGSAVLSFELPAPPQPIYPFEGATLVPTQDLLVSWTPDPGAAGFEVVLEQGETDRLAVQLPAGTSEFRVPDGVLAPGTRSHLEVGAVGPNGNRTFVQVEFSTQ